jgi:uncharacterized protein (UPF0332 family)
MSLEQWVEIRVLRAEPTSPDEIKALVGLVETRLNDARVDMISDDWRFAAAYNALLTSATIALRATGYRVPSQSGHHVRTLESLEFTIGADDTFIRRLKNFANKRGTATYEVAGAVSAQELRSVITSAEELHKRVIDWLQLNHKELL